MPFDIVITAGDCDPVGLAVCILEQVMATRDNVGWLVCARAINHLEGHGSPWFDTQLKGTHSSVDSVAFRVVCKANKFRYDLLQVLYRAEEEEEREYAGAKARARGAGAES